MAANQVKVRVWDWTVRTFHWALALLVCAMWWTAEQGFMGWHKWLGLGLIGLLVYRLVWGVIGPKSARLFRLVPGPKSLVGYIKTLNDRPYVPAMGHNPLGGLSVLALLTSLTLQAGSGLFAVDVDGLFSGWFGRYVSFDTGRAFSDFHESVFNGLIALITLHVIAIAAYRLILKTNLVGPMLDGQQERPSVPDGHATVHASPFRVLIALLIAFAVCWSIFSFGG